MKFITGTIISKRSSNKFLEEYLFTGLRNPLGMSYIANYNQFICKSIKI